MFVELHETMVNVVHRLLNRVKRLKIKVKRVFLDRAFSNIEVFRALDRRRLNYIVPLIVRGRSGSVHRLALMLGRAIENLFSISEIVQHRHSTILS